MENPPVYFTRDNGKLALCLSNVAKWFAGIMAALVIAGAGWFFSLVYQASENSRMALVEIRHLDHYRQAGYNEIGAAMAEVAARVAV